MSGGENSSPQITEIATLIDTVSTQARQTPFPPNWREEVGRQVETSKGKRMLH